MWVGHYRVVPGLPDLVIGYAPVQMPAIVSVYGVTVDHTKFLVSLGGLPMCRCRVCGHLGCNGLALFRVVGVLFGACAAMFGVIGSTLPAVLGVLLLRPGSPSSEDK